MTSIDELYDLRRFARAVHDAVPRIRARHPAAGPMIGRLSEQARELHARAGSPLAFAIVGEYSAGKSMLASVLLGTPGLLPVSAAPTTANVTAIRLVPTTGDTGPGLVETRIGFLSRTAVAEMVDRLLAGVRELAADLGADYPVRLLDGAAPLAEGWEAVDAFGRAVWRVPNRNADLTMRVAELTRLRDALALGEAMLPADDPGPMLSLSYSVLSAALVIGASRRPLAAYPEPQPVFPIDSGRPLDERSLELLQPLVRRVELIVAVDPEQWRWGPLLFEPGVELIDMPGLHSAGGTRDEDLAQQELARVTGVLMVLDARHPAPASLLTLDTFLERARLSREQLRHSKLVAANAFDALPTAGDGRSPAMSALQDMISHLTDGDPGLAAYTSPYATLALDDALPRSAQTTAAQLVASRRFWGGVAAGDPHRPDARALADYAVDGGLSGLRTLIVSHVLEHGLTVHVTELAERRDRMRLLLEEIRRRDSPSTPAPPGTVAGAQRVATAATEALALVREETGLLRRADLMVHEGRSLLDAVDDIVLSPDGGVYGWTQWATLLGRIRAGADTRAEDYGTIAAPSTEPGRAPGTPPAEDPFGAEPFGTEPFGTDPAEEAHPDEHDLLVGVEQLRTPFHEELHAAAVEMDDLVRTWVRAWGAEVLDRLGPRREALSAEALRPLAEALPNGRRRANRLYSLGTLGFVAPQLEQAIAQAPLIDVEDAFPLTDGRAFWWHPDRDRRLVSPVHAHHTAALRCRLTLTEAMIRRLHHRLEAILAGLVRLVQARQSEIAADVPGPAVLRRLTRPGEPRAPEPPDDVIDELLGEGADAAEGIA